MSENQNIPDIDIIDLDDLNEREETGNPYFSGETDIETEFSGQYFPEEENLGAENEEYDTSDEEYPEDRISPLRRFRYLNLHTVLITLVILCVIGLAVKYFNWGQFVDPSELTGDHTDSTQLLDTWDNIVPLTNADGDVIPVRTSDGLHIAVFGNHPFSDDRDSQKGLASLLAKETGGTVHNFSISGSYLASEQPNPDCTVQPWDAFTFYWMTLLTTDLEVNDYYSEAVRTLGDQAPPEALDVRQAIKDTDFDSIDIFIIMYDATDYLLGHNLNTDEGYECIQKFTGNLEAGIDILKSYHPNARIIVASPTYAFSNEKDDQGEYISSDIKIYAEQPLSMYAIAQCLSASDRNVSFIDNIYGTFNEDQAKDYLIDNLHLNEKGRKKVVSRIVKAIHYYGVD